MKVRLIPIAFAILAACTASNAQTRPEAWADLKALQERERTALHNRQQSELRLLVEIQKVALAACTRTRSERRALLNDHALERDRLSKRHSGERSELTRIHTAERASFLAPDTIKPRDQNRPSSASKMLKSYDNEHLERLTFFGRYSAINNGAKIRPSVQIPGTFLDPPALQTLSS